MPESGNTVLGEVPAAHLSFALTAIHRGGHGHHARVFNPERGDVRGQLKRAGIAVPAGLSAKLDDRVLIMLHAPGRVVQAQALLQSAGALQTHIVERRGAEAFVSPLFQVPARPAAVANDD
jgi:hypothetical protein